MSLRIDSIYYIATLWVLNVVMPGVLGGGGAIYILWNQPKSWGIGLIFAGVFCLIAIAFFYFVRGFSTSVCLDPVNGQLIVGNQNYTVDGTEICELIKKPNLAFLQLTLHDGTRVRLMPKLCVFYEIKAQGAQNWWRDKSNKL